MLPRVAPARYDIPISRVRFAAMTEIKAINAERRKYQRGSAKEDTETEQESRASNRVID